MLFFVVELLPWPQKAVVTLQKSASLNFNGSNTTPWKTLVLGLSCSVARITITSPFQYNTGYSDRHSATPRPTSKDIGLPCFSQILGTLATIKLTTGVRVTVVFVSELPPWTPKAIMKVWIAA